MRDSFIIILFFLLGCIVGLTGYIDITNSNIGFYVLCSLMFFVGVSIGINPELIKSFKSLNPRITLLPIMTIAGTLSATALVSFIFVHRPLTDCLAVGSGFGYYSLSSIFITEYKGAELGTIALLANIIREIVTLICAPFIIKWFGLLAPISCGGATTMDTTLPIIAQYSGEKYIPVSIYHGFIVDFSVPFLVTFFCSI